MRSALLFSMMLAITKGRSLHSENEMMKPLEWWQTAVIYQIYPRSFKDSDGDGIGDLKGIQQKVGYLKELGIGAVWISPIYKSPMADFGYDISDFREIESMFGTMQDFDDLLEKLHEAGIKVIMDFVPNHTSEEHEWFKKSVNREGKYTDYYVWKDAKIVNGEEVPPNNWLSGFSGSAWEWNDQRKQYYLHQFAKQQPDLNYENPAVVEDMLDVLRFWLDKKVDGFRMDAVFSICEDPEFRDEPLSGDVTALPTDNSYLIHNYTADVSGTVNIIKTFRKLLDSYSAKGSPRVMMTESYAKDMKKLMAYYGDSTHPGAHFPFNFLFITELTAQSTAHDFYKVIQLWYDSMPTGNWANWVLGNHDQSRVASRYGPELADGLNMMALLLPGTAVTYNGEEIGMVNTFVRWDQTVDPQGYNVGPKRYKEWTRDPERTPFQWDNTTSAGFSDNSKTWLPVNPNYWRLNLEQQRIDPQSHFKIYRQIIELRKDPVIQHGEFTLYPFSKWVFGFMRHLKNHPTIITILNLGSEMEKINLQNFKKSLPDKVVVYTASLNSALEDGQVVSSQEISLRPKASVCLTTYSLSSDEDKNIIFEEKLIEEVAA